MKRFLIFFLLLSFFCILMLSCALNLPKNLGSSVQYDDIKAMFENYEYVSNYNYFSTGYANGPEAILGIQKNYELVKVSGRVNVTNWQQFEPGGEKLKELVKANMTSQGNFRPVGADYSMTGVIEVWGPDNQLYGFG